MSAPTQHTPGPWRATKHTDTKGWTVSAGNSIASVKPRLNEAEVEANARLIAAAPEMSALLLSLYQHGHGGSQRGGIEDVLRKAGLLPAKDARP